MLVVDVQRDFCPECGGSLPASGCQQIIPALNAYVDDALKLAMPIYVSRDWHPLVTTHFKAYGGEWPPHCVQGSEGAEFHPDLIVPDTAVIISKGEDPSRPGYSAFDGHTPDGRPLLDDLRSRHIDALFIAGLTAEYCVRQTTLDGLRAGFDVTVLKDAVAGIEAQPGDMERALNEMAAAGARLTTGVVPLNAR